MPLSWISSTKTCVTPFRLRSLRSRLSRIPLVQNRRWVFFPLIPSSRTLNPTYQKFSVRYEIMYKQAPLNKVLVLIGVIQTAFKLVLKWSLSILANRFTKRFSSLSWHSFWNCHGRYSPRLCTNDVAECSSTRLYLWFQDVLRKLSCFTTSSLPRYNYYLRILTVAYNKLNFHAKMSSVIQRCHL